MLPDLSENDELALGPAVGLVAGALLGGSLTTVIPQAGLILNWPAPWVPWLVAAILGLLYGACQLRVPTRGIIAVGVFYGVFLWVLTNLTGLLFFREQASLLRSVPGFGMFIAYGLGLALCSLVAMALGGKSEAAQH